MEKKYCLLIWWIQDNNINKNKTNDEQIKIKLIYVLFFLKRLYIYIYIDYYFLLIPSLYYKKKTQDCFKKKINKSFNFESEE